MMLNAGSGWMVEGSPQRLLRDYNQLVDAYNMGAISGGPPAMLRRNRKTGKRPWPIC